jgi:hypothetical protein
MTERTADKVFDRAIDNSREVEESFPTAIVDCINIDKMMDFDNGIQTRIRASMENAKSPNQFLFNVSDIVAPSLSAARQLLLDGHVAAVDGTDAMQMVSLMNTSCFATAVGYVTSQTRSDPKVKVTTTSTKYAEPPPNDRHPTMDGDLSKLCDEMDQAREQESWTTTFREYNERVMAMECGAPWVFIDGPIFTQNLVSQERGRQLYSRLMRSGQSFVGIIKDISGSWTMSKWCGYSLKSGEGFVVCSVRNQFLRRFEPAGNGGIVKWLGVGDIGDFVRVVFRPNQKAFGFECRLRDLPMAMALIAADASPTINHELPVLLEIIDAQLRAGFHSSLAADVLIDRVQRQNYTMGVDITGERNFR